MLKSALVCAACLLAVANPALSSATPTEMLCRAIAFEGDISAGQSFARDIGEGLALELMPQNFGDAAAALTGWRIQILGNSGKEPPADRDDYIYLVNLPLRFNPSQDIGTSYGMTAQEKLRHVITYAFVLNKRDYEKMAYILDDALWPYAARDPKTAGDRYLSTLETLELGELRFVAVQLVTADRGQSIRKLHFRVDLTAPRSFKFSPMLAPHPSACPLRRQ
jgi:hypothetical protein